jgi:hypothetical protein
VAKKRLYVHSNDAERPKLALNIKAMIVFKVTCQPERLRLLLKDENAGAPELTLRSVDNRTFAIKGFQAPENCVTAAFDPGKQATEFVLKLKRDIEKLGKKSRGKIQIGLTHPECSVVTVPFTVVPRFEVTPRSISVRDAEPHKPIKRRVMIRSNYDDDFEIESASSDKGIMKVLDQEKTGTGYRLNLEIVPPPKDDKRYFADMLNVHIKAGRSLRIGCRGMYRREAERRAKR